MHLVYFEKSYSKILISVILTTKNYGSYDYIEAIKIV